MTATTTPEAADQVVPQAAGDRRTVWLGAARSGGVRLLTLPVSAVLGIVITRLVIENYGTAAFAQYGLLVGIGALLPFTDLGMSAAVMNAVGESRSPTTDPAVRRILVTAVRVLIGSASVLVLVALAVTVLDLWPVLLGDGLLPGSGPPVAMLCLVLVGLTMPVGIGQRILAALGRNHVSIAVLGMQTPLVLTVVLAFLWWDVPAGPAIALVAYGATLLLSIVCTLVAARMMGPVAGDVVRLVPRLRSFRGARVFDIAWPALVQMIALPLALQTDRIVLSHRADAAALAEYNLAAQMFTPIWAVVSSAGVTLWPVFARARARGDRSSPFLMAWAFAAFAAAMAAGVALASPWLAQVASGGAIQLGGLLVASFAGLMVLQGAKYPLSVFMTDARGLRFQAPMIVALLPVNVGLSWYLAGVVGAAGPVIGSVVGVAISQVLANVLYVRRRLRSPSPEGTPRGTGAT